MATTRAADQPEVHVERRHNAMLVDLEAAVAADVSTAWEVLTDYDRLAEFVPDMQVSRVAGHDGRLVLVEQRGEIDLLVSRAEIRVVLQVEEFPPERMVFRAVGGNVNRMQGEWRVLQKGAMVTLVYHAEIEPDFWVPPLVGSALMRRHVERQVSGVVQEVLRRYSTKQGRKKAAPAPTRWPYCVDLKARVRP